MEKIIRFTSTCVPLPIENVDTDQIIPSRFLKATTREGFGDNLFRDWRYNPDNSKKDFVLNDKTYSGKIMVAGHNFGSGSSREHAAWALYDAGFRAVISTFFGDIFKQNSLNNGLLPIVVSENILRDIFYKIEKDPKYKLIVDLENQELKDDEGQVIANFDIDPYKKMCIMQGLDDIDYLLAHKDEIVKFEESRNYDPITSQDPQTMFEKLWNAHIVREAEGFPSIFYIDAHLIHEVTSPQAFAGLKKRKVEVLRTDRTWATADHNVPTINQHLPIKELLSKKQVEMLEQNCAEFNVPLYGLGHPFQGIVHIIGPELGITQPGKTIVCGDSHTSTHGALGAYAFGIGTSEVEQVLASQCVLQNKPKSMKIEVNGTLKKGVTPKDVILYIISKLTASGGTGYFVEFAGEVFADMSLEGRMTVCNMSIEMGARGGMVAPDEKTYKYIKGSEFAPKGTSWDQMVEYWKSIPTDKDAEFDRVEEFDAADIEPMITYGTNPGMGVKINETIPTEDMMNDDMDRRQLVKSLKYMNLKQGQKMIGQKIDFVFFGSCTNSRIEDFRQAAQILKGKKKAGHVTAYLVPGSKQVFEQAKKEGLDRVFHEAGFELREPGCSACLGMNEDKIPTGKYCISTSNRNFEGRQGPGARTMLASPLTAAASAISGMIDDPRKLINDEQ